MNEPRISIGKEAAIAMAASMWWLGKSPREICDVQLFTQEVCMDFGDFQAALEAALGRPVWTHELALDYNGIVAEYLGNKPAPTMQDIIDLIPEGKRIILEVGETR